MEGRPLRIRESIAIARRRFWSILGPRLLMNFISGVISTVVTIVLFAILGLAAGDLVGTGTGLLISLLVSAPFVYVPAGVVLGEVGAGEAISPVVPPRACSASASRSSSRCSASSASSSSRSACPPASTPSPASSSAPGLVDNFPAVLVVPIAAALVFALGTLTFLVEAIAAAPAVHAFAALTHYTHGLEVGRREPVRGRHLWDPWVTPGLAAVSVLGLLILVGGVASISGG